MRAEVRCLVLRLRSQRLLWLFRSQLNLFVFRRVYPYGEYVWFLAAASESSLARKRGEGAGCELSILRSRVLWLVFADRRVLGCGAASDSLSWPSGFAASSHGSCSEFLRRGEHGCLGSAARVAARRARVFLAKGVAANDAANQSEAFLRF